MYKYLLAFLLTLFVFNAKAADTIINEYTPGKSIPTGFSVPWNLFNSNAISLQGVNWDNDTVTVRAGSGSNREYVYKNGFYWAGSSWVPFNFTGNASEDVNWFIGSADSTTKIPLQNNGSSSTPVIAFICNNVSGVWKCGCNDTNCGLPFWTVQSIKDTPLVETTDQCSANYLPPPQATALGFTNVKFCDDFSNSNTVNLTSESATNKWSRTRLSNWQSNVTTNPTSVYKFNTDGTLTISPSANPLGQLVSTWKDSTGTQKGYYTSEPDGYYVEFKWKHTDSNQSSGSPVVWGMGLSHLWANPYEKPNYIIGVIYKYLNQKHNIEIANFGYPLNTVVNNYNKSNNSIVTVSDYNTFGMLVTPTVVKWYVNNILVDTCTQGSCSFNGFSVLQDPIGWIISAGPGITYTIDYFKVFAK